jgi:hypothetical protein
MIWIGTVVGVVGTRRKNMLGNNNNILYRSVEWWKVFIGILYVVVVVLAVCVENNGDI